MTVRELIKKLQFCNQEAEVIMYHFNGECDGTIEYVKEIPNVTNDDVLRCYNGSIVKEEFIGEHIVYIICN
jgi:hypothetical protein